MIFETLARHMMMRRFGRRWRVFKFSLIFDFTNNGSATEELARDRAVHVLPPEDRAKAASLWSTLTDLALEVAANGGDRDRARLIADLQAKDFRLAGDRRFERVRAAVAEAARHALAEIDDRVGNASLAGIEAHIMTGIADLSRRLRPKFGYHFIDQQ